MGDKNIIELNGKLYDVTTGRLAHASKTTTPAHQKQGKPINDFVGQKTKPHHPIAVHPKPVAKSLESSRHINSKAAHKPERTKTLMRSTVKKPGSSHKPIHQVQATLSASHTRVLKVDPLASRTALNERQLVHSRQVLKSHLVNRFRRQEKLLSPKTTGFKETKPVTNKGETSLGHNSHSEYLGRTKDNILAAGLARATSHQEKFIAKPKRIGKTNAKHRHNLLLIAFGATVLLIVFIIGWLAYRNLANIELYIANRQSGVHAEMPSYLPSGFKVRLPIHYSSNSVVINFNSKIREDITIAQQNSNWDSQTLKDSYVILSGSYYQTFQSKGRTIYIFGHGEATWVNAGIWYRINGSADLNTTQLMNVANSM